MRIDRQGLRRVGVILRKELMDNLRDRRSWLMMLVYTALGPLILGVALSQAARQGKADRPLRLPVVGAERAPGLIEHLRQHDIDVRPPPQSPETAVREQQLDAVLVVPPAYPNELRGGRPAVVHLYVDASRTSGTAAVRRVEDVLSAYGRRVGALRLIARGIDPSIAPALSIERIDLSTPASRAMLLLAVLPMFLLLAVFMGGLYIAIDTTAGERERGSLESLCACPVRSVELVLGKLLAVMGFTTALTIVTAVLLWAALRLQPLDLPRMRLQIGPAVLARMLLLLLPLVLLVSALQLWLCSRSRSTKEAQTNAYLLTVLPVGPMLWQTLVPGRAPGWTMALPLVGQNQLLSALLRGEPGRPLLSMLACGSTLLIGGALVLLTVRRFQLRRDLLP